jgi:hypothetical protein
MTRPPGPPPGFADRDYSAHRAGSPGWEEARQMSGSRANVKNEKQYEAQKDAGKMSARTSS